MAILLADSRSAGTVFRSLLFSAGYAAFANGVLENELSAADMMEMDADELREVLGEGAGPTVTNHVLQAISAAVVKPLQPTWGTEEIVDWMLDQGYDAPCGEAIVDNDLEAVDLLAMCVGVAGVAVYCFGDVLGIRGTCVVPILTPVVFGLHVCVCCVLFVVTALLQHS